jgi:HD-like signal output (HDOD) protein
MRAIRIGAVGPGQVVAADVSNLHGQIIMRAGTVLEARHLKILRSWGIAEISIEGESEPTEQPEAQSTRPVRTWTPEDTSDPVLAELARLLQGLSPAKTDPSIPVGEPVAEPLSVPARPRHAGPPITAETLAARAGILASLPNIYFNVDRIVNHPTSSTADIAKALRSDQSLSARLLRLANSAFYGFPRRVESVEEAVRIIGTRQLHDLVLATVVLTQFKNVAPKLVSMTSFWRHSLACGIAARSLAALRREINTERFFVGGLLHDIGSLVLYQQLPDRAQLALDHHATNSATLDEAERAVIGCDHGAIGAALMTLWKLPEFYRAAAGHHHTTNGRQHSVGTAVIHVADWMVMMLDLGSNGEARPPRFCSEAWALLDLPTSSVAHTGKEVMALLAETERAFMGEGSS